MTRGNKDNGEWRGSVLQQVAQVICLKEVGDALTLQPPEIVVLFQGG